MTERRVYQRLHLRRPLDAQFGDLPVRLIDVSANGALIECTGDLPAEASAPLQFVWRGEEVHILATRARSEGKHSGLQFLEESETLRRLIAACATELLMAEEGNANGQRAADVDYDETLHAASSGPLASGFIVWTLTSRGWKATASPDPQLPEDGFVVRAAESDEQAELLCRSYETGDAEVRRLIRLLAELSVTGPT